MIICSVLDESTHQFTSFPCSPRCHQTHARARSDIAVAAAGTFGLLGMIVFRSLARNLWLVGGMASAVLAGSLAREEEGGALSDVVRAVGFEVALKARQLIFMARTGRLSYAYFKKASVYLVGWAAESSWIDSCHDGRSITSKLIPSPF